MRGKMGKEKGKKKWKMKKRRGQKEDGNDKDDLLNIRTEKKRKKVQKRKLEKR